MINDIGKKAYIVVLVVLICMPWLLWIILKDYMDTTNYENRVLATKPEFSLAGYEEFPDKYEEYLNDNLPFRNALITLNNRINYHFFDISANDEVIVGKDGWLFYNRISDGNSIALYQGRNLFNDEQLEILANKLINIRDTLEEQGVEFVLFIAPNKERIYYDMMPEYYGQPSEMYLTLQIVNYLRENTDIRVVYPYDELMEAKVLLEDKIIYHKVDTHWNNIGGYVGSQSLLAELGIEIPDVTSDEISISPIKNTNADLAAMLNISSDLIDRESNYSIEGYDEHNVYNVKWDFSEEIIYQSENADPRKLYVVRDSFCGAMSEYLGSQFNSSYMINKEKYSYDNFIAQDPDIFVIELVERSVDWLLLFELGNK